MLVDIQSSEAIRGKQKSENMNALKDPENSSFEAVLNGSRNQKL
jgi:hypothetical protein